MEIMLALAATEKPEAPNLTKTTINYATKRGFDLTVEEMKDQTQLWIWDTNEDSEPFCIYSGMPDGWHFHGNVYLKKAIVSQLPKMIADDKALRKVLDFLKTNVLDKRKPK
jgi:hypothetical protein